MAPKIYTPTHSFCPRCGGALTPRVLEEGRPARLVCGQCAFVFYVNPKLVAGVITMLDGGIVLQKRAIAPGRGKWAYPAGYVDLGETVAAAAVRETKEEVGLDVSLTGILDVYSYAGNDVVVVVYVADTIGGEMTVGRECLEIVRTAPEDIPWDELAFPSTYDSLRDYMRRFFPRVRLPR